MAQMVKNLPAMQETQVQSLGWEGSPREEVVSPLAVFLPGESHGQRSLAGYCPCGRKVSDMTEQLIPNYTLEYILRKLFCSFKIFPNFVW